MERSRTELMEKQQELLERHEQNRSLISMINHSAMEEKAEDVIENIRLTSKGNKNMNASDWQNLYKAVDELYPGFYELLTTKDGNMKEQHRRMCYLMKIGLNMTQIRNMTNLSRATVWRWTKRCSWILKT